MYASRQMRADISSEFGKTEVREISLVYEFSKPWKELFLPHSCILPLRAGPGNVVARYRDQEQVGLGPHLELAPMKRANKDTSVRLHSVQYGEQPRLGVLIGG